MSYKLANELIAVIDQLIGELQTPWTSVLPQQEWHALGKHLVETMAASGDDVVLQAEQIEELRKRFVKLNVSISSPDAGKKLEKTLVQLKALEQELTRLEAEHQALQLGQQKLMAEHDDSRVSQAALAEELATALADAADRRAQLATLEETGGRLQAELREEREAHQQTSDMVQHLKDKLEASAHELEQRAARMIERSEQIVTGGLEASTLSRSAGRPADVSGQPQPATLDGAAAKIKWLGLAGEQLPEDQVANVLLGDGALWRSAGAATAPTIDPPSTRDWIKVEERAMVELADLPALDGRDSAATLARRRALSAKALGDPWAVAAAWAGTLRQWPAGKAALEVALRQAAEKGGPLAARKALLALPVAVAAKLLRFDALDGTQRLQDAHNLSLCQWQFGDDVSMWRAQFDALFASVHGRTPQLMDWGVALDQGAEQQLDAAMSRLMARLATRGVAKAAAWLARLAERRAAPSWKLLLIERDEELAQLVLSEAELGESLRVAALRFAPRRASSSAQAADKDQQQTRPGAVADKKAEAGKRADQDKSAKNAKEERPRLPLRCWWCAAEGHRAGECEKKKAGEAQSADGKKIYDAVVASVRRQKNS